MKTPREILLRRHQAAEPKLDAIRAGVLAGMAHPPAPENFSWREIFLSLRWHLAALSAAWVVVALLNTDRSRGAAAMIPRAVMAEPRQIWASLRESRRLLLQYTDAPIVETPAVPGRRSKLEPEQIEV
jgi:hypothetical protein